MSQPDTWAETVDGIGGNLGPARRVLMDNPADVYLFTGCGTSYYLAITAAALFQEITGRPARAVPASEVYLAPDWSVTPRERAVLFAISRSGNTTETLLAMDHFIENRREPVVGLTCCGESALAQKADVRFVLAHAAEKSVVMTRSFTNLLLAIQLLAGALVGDDDLLREINRLPALGRQRIDSFLDVAARLGRDESISYYVYLGLGAYYGMACEAALKIKEMTQVSCEAYSTLEYRHGPISVIDHKSGAVLLCSDRGRKHETSVVSDIMRLGGRALVIGEGLDHVQADWQLSLNSGLPDRSRALLYMMPLQLMAFERAVVAGLNPDQPRHLGQVVILEEP